MILDGLLVFTGPSGTGDLPTTGTQNSSNVLDLGLVGLPASISGGGGGGARDIGIGDDPAMKLLVQVLTAFTGGTSLQVALQGAPDSGTGTPGAYTTMLTGPAVVEANLIAGSRILDDDMPRPVPGQAIPRYLRLSYITVGTHTAGAIFGTIVLDRHDLPLQSNATLGGYPAGITVAN
jgi:hypothetical protein